MDPVRNPYAPGAGAPPPALVGRDRQIQDFDIAIQRLALGRHAKSLMLTGLRGVGKTVLLHRFCRIASSHRWVYIQLEAGENQRFAESIASSLRSGILRLSAGRRMTARARRALGVLRTFQLRWGLPNGSVLEANLDPVPGIADSGFLDYDLEGLFTEVGELARERDVGVLLTVDEIQYLNVAELAALIVGLHRVSQEQLPFMVAAAGLPSVPALAGEAKSYSERLFSFPVIGNLHAEQAREALVTPAAEEGVLWHPDALESVVDVTEGYPYFLQEFGKQVWDISDGTNALTLDDVELALPIAMDELDTGFFRVRFDRSTKSERAYLGAMASLGAGPYQSGQVASLLGKTTAQVGVVRDGLIKRGLCYAPSHGVIAFTVPLFDQFVRRWGD